MRTICKTVFTFNELSDKAKKKAREWYKSQDLGYGWWDSVFENASIIASLFGLDIRNKPVKMKNGKTQYPVSIFFSGFYSQGDGASFEGRYTYKDGATDAVKEYAPEDGTLHSIVNQLQNLQHRHSNRLEATIKQSGRYSHEFTMSLDMTWDDDYSEEENIFDDEATSELLEIMRDFARWIYKNLEREYDYLMSDEVVDETLISNDYEFDEFGTLNQEIYK